MTKSDAASGRDRRLASALRDNLRRRKAATRPVEAPAGPATPVPDERRPDPADKADKR